MSVALYRGKMPRFIMLSPILMVARQVLIMQCLSIRHAIRKENLRSAILQKNILGLDRLLENYLPMTWPTNHLGICGSGNRSVYFFRTEPKFA